VTPKTTGNEIIIEFSLNTCKKYVNGILDNEITYKIEMGNSIIKNEETDIITLENEWRQSIELNGNKLTLYDECYDCFQNE